MWSYYGSKTNIVDYYPAPVHGKIIEPFSGSARYSLKYFDREVLLVDKYDVIIKMWQWLQKCSPNDILSLPILKEGETLDSFNFDCEEAKLFMGFTVAFGMAKPHNKATKHCTDRPNFIRFNLQRAATQLFKIKHWEFENCSYDQVQNQTATWFIDPPYQNGGQAYAFNNKQIDYAHLSDFCKDRLGQVIVCEEMKANWLKFNPVIDNKSGRGKNRIEAIWTNFETHYTNTQTKLF